MPGSFVLTRKEEKEPKNNKQMSSPTPRYLLHLTRRLRLRRYLRNPRDGRRNPRFSPSDCSGCYCWVKSSTNTLRALLDNSPSEYKLFGIQVSRCNSEGRRTGRCSAPIRRP
jgi:hypothetical protein